MTSKEQTSMATQDGLEVGDVLRTKLVVIENPDSQMVSILPKEGETLILMVLGVETEALNDFFDHKEAVHLLRQGKLQPRAFSVEVKEDCRDQFVTHREDDDLDGEELGPRCDIDDEECDSCQ